jgi:hypothetical protein
MTKITHAFPHVYSPQVIARKAIPKSALNVLIPLQPVFGDVLRLNLARSEHQSTA